MTFTHEPAAPSVPADHPTQRYFCGEQVALCGSRWVSDVARVYRFAGDAAARLDLRTPFNGKCHAEVTADLTPPELRELARRLLDAAHDIETEPAKVTA
jgi:hypothetical protein